MSGDFRIQGVYKKTTTEPSSRRIIMLRVGTYVMHIKLQKTRNGKYNSDIH